MDIPINTTSCSLLSYFGIVLHFSNIEEWRTMPFSVYMYILKPCLFQGNVIFLQLSPFWLGLLSSSLCRTALVYHNAVQSTCCVCIYVVFFQTNSQIMLYQVNNNFIISESINVCISATCLCFENERIIIRSSAARDCTRG